MLIYKQNISESFEAKQKSAQQQPHNLPPPSAVPLSNPSPQQMKDKKLPPSTNPMQPVAQPPVIQPVMQPAVQPVMQQGVQPYNIKPTITQSQKMNSSIHQEISE